MQVSDKGLILKWFVVMPPLRHVTVQFLITSAMQKRRGKAWPYLSTYTR